MLRKNVSGQTLYFCLVKAADGTALTGASVTAKRSIDGAAQASCTGTVSEDALGQYHLALSQADTNGNDIGYLFTATGAIPVHLMVVTTAADPTDTVRFGLTALPSVASGSAGAIPTTGTGANQISVSSGAVIVQAGTGTGQLSLSSGKVAATLASTDVTGNVAADLQTIKAQTVTCAAGVTVGAYVGNATAALGVDASGRIDLGKWLGTVPLALSSQQVQSVVPSSTVVASVSGAVGSVTGAVGSVTGAVGSVTAAVTLSAGDSPVFYSSTATAGGASTLTDSGQTWTVNVLAGCRVKITSGTGTKQSRVIVSNTATVLTVDRAWTTTPSTDSVYAVVENEQPALSSGLKVTGVVLADTVTTYTGNTPQTGDSYVRIGAAGAGLTALGDSRIAHLDADVTSRLAPTVGGRTLDVSATGEAGLDWANIGAPTTAVALTGTTISPSQVAASVSAGVTVTTNNDKTGYSISGTKTTLDALNDITAVAVWAVGTRTLTASLDPTSATIAAAVWDLATSGHTMSGTFGAAMNAAGSAGDPWGTALPGAYGAGTAGFIVGTNLNATVSSRSTYAGADTSGTTTLLGRIPGTVQPQTGDAYARIGAAGAGLTAVGDTRLAHLDADVSSRSTYAGGDTSGTTTLLARLTSTRAGNLDNLDVVVSTRLATSGYTVAPTVAAIATGVWQDTTVGDFAVSSSIGKSLFTSGAVPGAAGGLFIAGTNAATTITTALTTTFAGNLTGSVGSVTAPVTVGANSDKAGYSLATAGLDTVHVETGLNARQALAIIASACAGVLSGASGTAIAIAAAGVPATNRIAATVDGDGNRTAVTLTPPA